MSSTHFPGMSHQEPHPLFFHPIFQDCPIRSPTHFALTLTGAPVTSSPNSTGAPPTVALTSLEPSWATRVYTFV